MTKLLEYVEIDVNYCSLTYGTSPCTAAIPTTGDKKCFNTLATCQDRANFDDDPVTLRFAKDTGYNPADIECIPNIIGIETTAARISLGENLGTRSSVTIRFVDHRHSDTGTGFDKYLADRSYDPFTQGTFWGKFRARHPFLRGRALRVIRGSVGQALGAMETRHYVIDSYSGPNAQGEYTITAKDPLKLADNDRALAPAVSNGSLNAGITDSATSATLSPAGIGNAEYPASGKVNIGGKEICSFTRSGDTLTLTRAQLNTTAVAHNAEDRVQLVLEYSGEDPADIIEDLLVNYAGVPSSYISSSSWAAETGAYLQRVYTAYIAEPTGVNKLVSELVEQAALVLWWDDIAQEIKLQVLRDIAKGAQVYNSDNLVRDSINIADQQDRRVSRVLVYYAQRNPLRPLEDLDNYNSTYININAQNETDYGSAAIKRILSRWVPAFGQSTADRLSDIVLARFSNAPRKVEFDVFKTAQTAPELAAGYFFENYAVQTDEGEADQLPIQVISLRPGSTMCRVIAEELRFDGITLDDPNNRVITIDNNTTDFNLRTVHDTLFPVITDATGITLTVNINSGVIVGGSSPANVAFDVGSWIDLPAITINIFGRIQGAGGAGGAGTSTAADDGQDGGTALKTTVAITVDNQGQIWGGGGGGAGNAVASGTNQRPGGGGGAGYLVGAGGAPHPDTPTGAGQDGTTEAGGAGGFPTGFPSRFGGDGGDPGQAGGSAYTGSGSPGAAGNAIDGVSNITFTTAGSRLGPEIN